MRYYQYHWDESRGEAFPGWGSADYFFETDDSGIVLRQVEVYANGTILRYSGNHMEDAYGKLTDQPQDPDEMRPYASDRAAFERVWPSGVEPGPQGV